VTTEDTQPIGETFEPVAPEPGPPPETAAEAAPGGAPFEPAPVEPIPTARPKARSGLAGWINVALGLALAIAVGGVAFAAGRMTAPGSAAGANSLGSGPNGRVFSGNGYFPGGGANGGAGGPRVFGGGASVEGTVTAVSAGSITIKTASGQEITIALDSATTYHQQSAATSTDVKTGGTVIVRLGLGRAGSGTQTGPTANDITVVPQ